MKNKTYILNFTLAVLFALSLEGNMILFNQFSNSKQTLASLQNQLEESKVKLQEAQADWKTLQASLEVPTQIAPSETGPADPNKKLSSGRTLLAAKRMIDGERARCNERGYSAEDTKSLLAQLAKDLGTTLDEVERLPDAPVNIVKPAEQGKTTQPSTSVQQQTPSTNNQDLVGTPGAFPKTSWDTDGNGINDDDEAITLKGDGTTHSDPNFNLKSN